MNVSTGGDDTLAGLWVRMRARVRVRIRMGMRISVRMKMRAGMVTERMISDLCRGGRQGDKTVRKPRAR